MIFGTTIVNGSNLPTASGQLITQIESGLVVLALAFVARYIYKLLKEIKDQREDQKTLTNSFVEHVQDDRNNFQILMKFMKQQRRAAKKAEKAAKDERVAQTLERQRVKAVSED